MEKRLAVQASLCSCLCSGSREVMLDGILMKPSLCLPGEAVFVYPLFEGPGMLVVYARPPINHAVSLMLGGMDIRLAGQSVFLYMQCLNDVMLDLVF